ncbi:alpha/beta hydrolase [Kitasatospora xanthocidica]|uniref:alpha/beta fold hydrolase n=1 Tax=Kitasatospora xanthocidica TaxID=83382 RepID=UPI001674138A|nr:alpha/beta fold hydrolase [Kitasatospora xanthocidica]GHF27593.1 alpha/beta hydrolase [Kitasatospora xanthocidica]
MSTVVSTDGTTLACTVTGSGPAVVLVDGATTHRAFDPGVATAEQLSAHHTVWAYDRRGRGASGDTAPFAVEREIEDLAAVVAAAGGSAAVYGISSGAALALRAAAAGVAMTRLAVYEPPFSTEAAQSARFVGYVTELETALAEGRRGDAVAAFMTFVGLPAEMLAGMRAAPMWPLLEAIAPTLAYDAAALGARTGGTVPVDVLARITVPTLVLDGGASPELLRAPAAAVAAAVPGAEYRTLAGQTHDVAAGVLVPELVKFFA